MSGAGRRRPRRRPSPPVPGHLGAGHLAFRLRGGVAALRRRLPRAAPAPPLALRAERAAAACVGLALRSPLADGAAAREAAIVAIVLEAADRAGLPRAEFVRHIAQAARDRMAGENAL